MIDSLKVEDFREWAMENNVAVQNGSKQKTNGKMRYVLKLLHILKWVVIGFFASSLYFVILFKFVNPPVTPLMVIRLGEQLFKGEKLVLKKKWIDIEEVSPNMIKALIAAEDNLYMRHDGFDRKAIERAYKNNKRGGRIRGGSTISQQTAKNVFLWPNRTYLRKGLEVYFTFLIERIWGKKRILEVYLNVIETGKGIYGVEKASMIYFGTGSAALTRSQAAMIAAVLPSPRRYSVTRPGPYIRSRQAYLLRMMPIVETINIKKKSAKKTISADKSKKEKTRKKNRGLLQMFRLDKRQ